VPTLFMHSRWSGTTTVNVTYWNLYSVMVKVQIDDNFCNYVVCIECETLLKWKGKDGYSDPQKPSEFLSTSEAEKHSSDNWDVGMFISVCIGTT